MESQEKNEPDDREFIAGVWQKVRYLEYLKREEEIVKENTRHLLKLKVKTALCLLAAALIVAVPLILAMGINIFTIIITGTVLLSEGILYEHIENTSIYRRTKHEN
jgi:hypothetical protein